MKTSNNPSTALNQYNEVIINYLNNLIQSKIKYNSKQLKALLETTYFKVLPLDLAKQQRITMGFLLENNIVKRSDGNYYTKAKQIGELGVNAFKIADDVIEIDEKPTKEALIIIDRSTPTINSITELYFDLLEAYQNGDIRVKTSDYLEALRELSILNSIIPAPQESQITDISFSLGCQELSI